MSIDANENDLAQRIVLYLGTPCPAREQQMNDVYRNERCWIVGGDNNPETINDYLSSKKFELDLESGLTVVLDMPVLNPQGEINPWVIETTDLRNPQNPRSFEPNQNYVSGIQNVANKYSIPLVTDWYIAEP